MPRPIQQADAARALQRQFDLKGHIGLSLDEVVVPVQDGGDFAGKSPFAERRLVGDVQVAPNSGAGTYAGMFITPAPSTVLVIDRLRITNASGVSQGMWVGLMRPADVAAVTIIGPSASIRMNGVMLASGFGQQGAATSTTFHHTAFAVLVSVDRVYAVNSATEELVFPRGYILDGTDPLGPLSLGIMTGTANQTTPDMSWYATEYPVQP